MDDSAILHQMQEFPAKPLIPDFIFLFPQTTSLFPNAFKEK